MDSSYWCLFEMFCPGFEWRSGLLVTVIPRMKQFGGDPLG
jgi:hypothetical protein